MSKKNNIMNLLSLFAGVIIGILGMRVSINKKVEQNQLMSDKHMSLFLLMNQWIKVKQEGKSLAFYFEQKGYYKIAVYGMSYVGNALVNELKDTNIDIKYGIDQCADTMNTKMEIVLPDSKLEKVDAIIVTPITYFTEIEKQLINQVECPIISLEDILFEV